MWVRVHNGKKKRNGQFWVTDWEESDAESDVRLNYSVVTEAEIRVCVIVQVRSAANALQQKQ